MVSTTLKEALKARGMTVQQLSDVTGISKRLLDAYMTGYRKLRLASAQNFLQIANALDIDPRDLADANEHDQQ